MLDSPVSPDGAVVVLSEDLGMVDCGLLDDSDGSKVDLVLSFLIEPNIMLVLNVEIGERGRRDDRCDIGSSPYLANCAPIGSDLQNFGIVKVDHQVDLIILVAIPADVVFSLK